MKTLAARRVLHAALHAARLGVVEFACFLFLVTLILPLIARLLAPRRRVGMLVYHNPKRSRALRHMNYLRKTNRLVDLNSVIRALDADDWSAIPRNAVVVSFDDGHIGNRDLLDLFEACGVKPTIYLCSQIVDTRRRFWWTTQNAPVSELKRISGAERLERLKSYGFRQTDQNADGPRQALDAVEIAAMEPHVEFGSHTRFHPILPLSTDHEAAAEIADSKSEVEALTNRQCMHFAYPNGSYGEREVSFVRAAGYRSARTLDIGWISRRSDRYRLPVIGMPDNASVVRLRAQLHGVAFMRIPLRSLRRLWEELRARTAINATKEAGIEVATELAEPIETGDAASFDDEGRDLRAAAGGGALSLLGGILNAAFSFGFTVTVTHVLRASSAGAFFVAMAVFSIAASAAQLGAAATVVRMVAWERTLGHTRAIREGLAAALIPVALTSLVLAGVGAAFADAIAGHLGIGGKHLAGANLIRVFAVGIPIAALLPVVLSATRGFGRMLPTIILDYIGEPFLRLCLVSFGAVLTLSPGAVAAMWIAPSGLALIVSSRTLHRLLTAASPGPHEEAASIAKRGRLQLPGTVWEFWRYTAPQWSADVFQLGVLWLDVVLVGALASPSSAAVYGALSRFLLVGSLGLAAVVLVLAPLFSELLAANRLERIRVLYSAGTSGATALAVPVFLMMAVEGSKLLSIFGEEYSAGARALTILSLAMIADTLAGPALLLLLSGGLSKLVALNAAASLVINITLNLLLIPRFGIEGAAIAWGVSTVLINALALAQAHRRWGVAPFGPGLTWIVGSAAAVFGGLGLTLRDTRGSGVGPMATSLLIQIAIYSLILWLGRGSILGPFAGAVRARVRASGRPARFEGRS